MYYNFGYQFYLFIMKSNQSFKTNIPFGVIRPCSINLMYPEVPIKTIWQWLKRLTVRSRWLSRLFLRRNWRFSLRSWTVLSGTNIKNQFQALCQQIGKVRLRSRLLFGMNICQDFQGPTLTHSQCQEVVTLSLRRQDCPWFPDQDHLVVSPFQN